MKQIKHTHTPKELEKIQAMFLKHNATNLKYNRKTPPDGLNIKKIQERNHNGN